MKLGGIITGCLAALCMTSGVCQAQSAEIPAYRPPAADTARAVAASMAMALIPAGEFQMGSDDTGYQNGYPRHTVHIAEFRMARYTVTFDQYDAFARATDRPLPPDERWGRGAHPVVNVDWSEISAFIHWVNAGSQRHFRLPSESEWEYSARARTTTAYWWGDEPNPDYANTAADTGKDSWPFTAPVGSFPANPFGLFDVLGNVWQVVQDCRHLTYVGAPVDGSAWVKDNCEVRVVRGGYYGSLRIGMRSNSRSAAGQHFRSMGLGFRLAE